MTQDKFDSIEKKVLAFAEKYSLQAHLSREFKEVSFISDFGMEAIDTETLENPTDIATECYLMVYLPPVGEDDEDRLQRNVYQNVAWELMRIAKPDYLIGAENGIVKAVMFCVWA